MKELTLNETLFKKLMHTHRKLRRSMGGEHGHRPHFMPRHDSPEGCDGPPFGHFPMHCMTFDNPDGHMKGPHRPPLSREHILETLASNEEGMRQKDIRDELNLQPSTVSEFIGQLERDGYVTRTIDPTDKRATLIKLTEMGSARAAELQDERDERFASLFTNLSEEEKTQLVGLLTKLIGEEEHPFRHRHHGHHRHMEETPDD